MGRIARTFLIAVFLAFGAYLLFFSAGSAAKEISFSEFIELAANGKVQPPVVIDGSRITGKLQDGIKFSTRKEKERQIGPELEKYKIKYLVKEESRGGFWPFLFDILPFVLLFGIAWFFIKRQAGGQIGFGKAKVVAPSAMSKKTFADVAGIDEAVEEAREVVDMFRGRKDIERLGGRMPKGVLLMGDPGTGKTLLARVMAGEAGVPFLVISGSDFVEMFVGVGASRVRSLFEQAKKQSPCIIFIDELDAMGRQRGTGIGGGHDEREQTLNQILVEMDGFEQNAGILMIAATNRPDILDAALLRPGRFDRKIFIPRPDIVGREKILQIHTANMILHSEVDLSSVAKGTPGMTGADLENLANEAALIAARSRADAIEMAHFDQAREKILIGQKRSGKVIEEERRIAAIHEAGHAIANLLCADDVDPLYKVSIVRRGMAGGVTWSLPSDDRRILSRKRAAAEVAVLLGGRAAELLILGPESITSGAGNDLERATEIVRNMVAKFGMDSKFGLAAFGDSASGPFLGREMALHGGISPGMQEKIEERVCELISEHFKITMDMLAARKSDLEKLMGALLEKEEMMAEEIIALLKI